MVLSLLEFCNILLCNAIFAVQQMPFISPSQLLTLCCFKQVYWIFDICSAKQAE